jgi:hypothetical protein
MEEGLHDVGLDKALHAVVVLAQQLHAPLVDALPLLVRELGPRARKQRRPQVVRHVRVFVYQLPSGHTTRTTRTTQLLF